jgi:pilus assembly protein TadC
LDVALPYKKRREKMKTHKLIWIPRVLAIVFIAFLLLFGLDVFSENAPFIKKLGGFFMQSIPSFILLLILFIFWKKPLIGGFLFILFSIAFTLYFRTYGSLSTFLLLTLPMVLVGILFIALDLIAKKSGKAA